MHLPTLIAAFSLGLACDFLRPMHASGVSIAPSASGLVPAQCPPGMNPDIIGDCMIRSPRTGHPGQTIDDLINGSFNCQACCAQKWAQWWRHVPSGTLIVC